MAIHPAFPKEPHEILPEVRAAEGALLEIVCMPSKVYRGFVTLAWTPGACRANPPLSAS